MKANVVVLDRTIRMGLGMLLLASPVLELPTYPFNLLGLVLIVTAAFGYCPLYGLFSALKPVRSPDRASQVRAVSHIHG
jgi:Protein of unknown function (DUF2892)